MKCNQEQDIPTYCTTIKEGEKLRDLDNFSIWKINDKGESTKVYATVEQIEDYRIAISGLVKATDRVSSSRLVLSSAIIEWSIGTSDEGYKPILWVKTELGYWYNLLTPSADYKSTFSKLAEQLHLLELCSLVLDESVNLSYEKVILQLKIFNITEDMIIKHRKFLIQHLRNLFTSFDHKPFMKYISNEKKNARKITRIYKKEIRYSTN